MQIWNGCNMLNIAGNPIKDINVNLSFLSSGSKAVEWTIHPGFEKFLNSFLSSVSKVVEWTTPCWKKFQFHFWFEDPKLWNEPPSSNVWWTFFEILLLHVLSNDACKFAINLFPISWGSFEMLIYYIFYWKCRFEMAVMYLILQETP